MECLARPTFYDIYYDREKVFEIKIEIGRRTEFMVFILLYLYALMKWEYLRIDDDYYLTLGLWYTIWDLFWNLLFHTIFTEGVPSSTAGHLGPLHLIKLYIKGKIYNEKTWADSLFIIELIY